METNPPGANRPLTNLAQSCSYSVKSNKMVAVKVHETFDFPEIESDTIFFVSA